MVLTALVLACLQSRKPTLNLQIDATGAADGVIRTIEAIQVGPGEITLAYPRWHDGNHRPTGPINSMTNLHFYAGGQEVAWKRDQVDLYHFHVFAPAGTSAVTAVFDFVAEPGTDFSSQLTRLPWNQYLLFPAGAKHNETTVACSVKLPSGWSLATPILEGEPSNPVLKTTTLGELVDSPGLAGKNLTEIRVGSSEYVDVASDLPNAKPFEGAFLDKTRNLVAEAKALFGPGHYRTYRFLVSVSDEGAWQGLEHHECSEDGYGAKGIDSGPMGGRGELLAHEYTHSWNGKYRRPNNLYTTDYDTPQQGDLLWVYEGMTQFWGKVLAARAGFRSAQEFRDDVAAIVGRLQMTSGRTWRPLDDTATSVYLVRGAPQRWADERRRGDYYDEAVLIWLEVDSILREQTHGKKSMDDFCKLFHYGENGHPEVKTYTFDDVMATLQKLAPYDWRTLLKARAQQVQSELSLAGLENEGWLFEFNDQPGDGNGDADSFYTIGVRLGGGGEVETVARNGMAWKAGLRPGMKIKSVFGGNYSGENFRKALAEKSGLDLVVTVRDETRNVHIPYRGGLRYPHLRRIEDKPDLLSKLIAPRNE